VPKQAPAQARREEVSRPTPTPPVGPWKDAAAATAYLGRVQKLLDARGLDGTEPKIKPLMKKATAAFQARDFAAFTAACDELVDVIEAQPSKLAE
jgi:hypothetical protein